MIVRIVSAIGGGVLDVEAKPNSTIGEIKREISKQKHIPASAVIVVFRGRQLEDNESLEEAGIQDYEKIYLIARTEGGGK